MSAKIRKNEYLSFQEHSGDFFQDIDRLGEMEGLVAICGPENGDLITLFTMYINLMHDNSNEKIKKLQIKGIEKHWKHFKSIFLLFEASGIINLENIKYLPDVVWVGVEHEIKMKSLGYGCNYGDHIDKVLCAKCI